MRRFLMNSTSHDKFRPVIGMNFDSLDEAWKFWVDYGGKAGFGVRKHYFNKNKRTGFITSYIYVCCKEGVRKQEKRDLSHLNPRLETRTNCKVRMRIKHVDGKYIVDEFIEDHNHSLHLQETVHMLASQHDITKVQAHEIDLAEDAGVFKQKSTFQLMSRQAGDSEGPQSESTQLNVTSQAQYNLRKRPAPQEAPEQTNNVESETQTTPSKATQNSHSIFETNDGEVCAEYIPGVATSADRQAISHNDYDLKLKVFALHQARATAALSDLMPEICARPPPSVLDELEDLKREMASARSKEKEQEATISRLTHKNKVFSAQCASYECQVVALEAENKKTKEELMVAAKTYYSGGRATGFAEGLKEGKAKCLKSVEFLHHLTDASMQYFDYGFDSCQKQAELQGFVGQLNKDCALKEAPDLKGWDSSAQPE
ncbi:hypothetical protein ACS0TY_015318 [Phlomoides rotata]